MSEVAQAQLAELDALLVSDVAPVSKPTPAQRPQTKPVPSRRSAPARVSVPDSAAGALVPEDGAEDDWDVEPIAPKTAPVSVSVPVAQIDPASIVYRDGWPDIEADAELIRLRANYARLQQELREATVKVEESCAVLNLKPGQIKPGRVSRIAAELHEAGLPLTDVDAYESRLKLQQRLTDAAAIAAAKIAPHREVVVRRMLANASEKLKPTFTKLALAHVELVRASIVHRKAVAAMQAAGFPPVNEYSVWGGDRTTDVFHARQIFADRVKSGVLAAEDVTEFLGEYCAE